MNLTLGKININHAVILAPMDDITDSPFRRICKEMGADVVFSEFVSSEGIIRHSEKSLKKFQFHPEERPIGLQIYGHNPQSMLEAARIAEKCQPDFIDINAGCPVRKLVSKGSCSALLKDLPLLKSIIREVVKSTTLPVTVKMRIGWDRNSIVIPDAIRMMEDQGIKTITIHARTRDQGYKGQADWTWIEKAVQSVNIPIIGNGDIRTHLDGYNRFREIPDLAGIMIGRGSLGNPWIFKSIKNYLKSQNPDIEPTIHEKFSLMKKHLHYSIEERGERLGIILMRKHLSGYLKGLYQATRLRSKLMQTAKYDEVLNILNSYLESSNS